MAKFTQHYDAKGVPIIRGDVVQRVGGNMRACKGALALVKSASDHPEWITVEWFGPGGNNQSNGMYYPESFEVLPHPVFEDVKATIGMDVVNVQPFNDVELFGKHGTITGINVDGSFAVSYDGGKVLRFYDNTTWGVRLVPKSFHILQHDGTYGPPVCFNVYGPSFAETEAEPKEEIDYRIDILEADVKALEDRTQESRDLTGAALDKIGERIEDHDSKVNAHKSRLDAQSRRLLRVEKWIDDLNDEVDVIRKDTKDSENTVKSLGTTVGNLRKEVQEQKQDLDTVRRMLTNVSVDLSAVPGALQALRLDMADLRKANVALLSRLEVVETWMNSHKTLWRGGRYVGG